VQAWPRPVFGWTFAIDAAGSADRTLTAEDGQVPLFSAPYDAESADCAEAVEMAEIILVTGGARSGKSAHALQAGHGP